MNKIIIFAPVIILNILSTMLNIITGDVLWTVIGVVCVITLLDTLMEKKPFYV